MDAGVTSMKLRIDWSELDSFGHINNLAILRYAQTARLNCLEQMGMMDFHAARGIGPILASTSCQFRRQLYYPGEVTVRTRIDHLKTTSFHMRHTVLNGAGEAVAEVHDVLVMFDFHQHAKLPVPELFREKMLQAGAVAG